ncbi:MAG: dTDP-glucose 4,6-dehydratase [Nitrospinae bacterium]|nr:dTDP-glucose 4,6-dehydratase [Nitrospinota bacterium]
MKLLVTGGAGFIGSNFVRLCLKEHADRVVVNLDKLTYAGNPENLKDVEKDPRYRFVRGDICDPDLALELMRDGIDAVVHFAAESHVDRSIHDPAVFLDTNILGTHNLLKCAREASVSRFLQVSTDEVYGSLGPAGVFVEESPLRPNSPYAASKAGADLICRSFFETFSFPVVVTRCGNNYGPYQFPEKLIPLFVTNLLDDIPVPLYGDGLNVRDWIHVEDHCRAIDAVLRKGRPGEVYNIGGRAEKNNLQITEILFKELGKPETLKKFVKDRLGHDRRYAIDPGKLERELGWSPRFTFEQGIKETIAWYKDNEHWWRPLKERVLKTY